MPTPPTAEKTVFLSYRRAVSFYQARSVMVDLRSHGYDVFMDVESIDSGEFESIILNQIKARMHFVVVLTPGSLARATDESDWLRREIERALELERNIVPVLMNQFQFESEQKLPNTIQRLQDFNRVTIHDEYFNEGMTKLRTRFLKRPQSPPELVSPPAADLPIVAQKIDSVLAHRARQATTTLLSTGQLPIVESRNVEHGTLALHHNVLESGDIVLRWSAVPEAESYVIQTSVLGDFSSLVPMAHVHSTEFVIKKYIGGPIPMFYRVGWVVSGLVRGWSNKVKAENLRST